MVGQDKREAAEMMEKAVNVTNEAAKKVESTLSALKEVQARAATSSFPLPRSATFEGP